MTTRSKEKWAATGIVGGLGLLGLSLLMLRAQVYLGCEGHGCVNPPPPWYAPLTLPVAIVGAIGIVGGLIVVAQAYSARRSGERLSRFTVGMLLGLLLLAIGIVVGILALQPRTSDPGASPWMSISEIGLIAGLVVAIASGLALLVTPTPPPIRLRPTPMIAR